MRRLDSATPREVRVARNGRGEVVCHHIVFWSGNVRITHRTTAAKLRGRAVLAFLSQSNEGKRNAQDL